MSILLLEGYIDVTTSFHFIKWIHLINDVNGGRAILQSWVRNRLDGQALKDHNNLWLDQKLR